MERRFPIVTDTACQFKWTWSTVFLSRGTTASCHRCRHWEITPETFMDFHNHPGKLADREKMLAGEWPGNGCEYCRDIEVAGGESERSCFINSIDLVPPELAADPTATRVTPRLLEIYFSNLCNQACAYCTPQFSSTIEQEFQRFGPIPANPNYRDISKWRTRVDYAALKAKFWEWMEAHSHELLQFQILGGEPLYQEEFDECLRFFESHPNGNLEWQVFTNLKHDAEKLQRQVDRLKGLVAAGKLRAFRFVCSFDCWGPQAEYARYGTQLAKWEANFRQLLDAEHIGLHIHSTLTALTIETLATLMQKIAGWREKKLVTHSVNTVTNPTIFDLYAFGSLLSAELQQVVDECRDDRLKLMLAGMKARADATQPDRRRLADLRSYLDEIDRRRGSDWRRLYPRIVAKIDEALA
jgi:hypothetical protein